MTAQKKGGYIMLGDIKRKIELEIKEKKMILRAWENVTFPTKEDGTPFKIMQKNIKGATYKTDRYAFRECEKDLYINTHSPDCGYTIDKIQAHDVVRYMKNNKAKEKPENIAPHEPLLEDIYVYDLDDIKEAVSAHIEYLKEEIILLNKQLQNVEKSYNAFETSYEKCKKRIV